MQFLEAFVPLTFCFPGHYGSVRPVGLAGLPGSQVSPCLESFMGPACFGVPEADDKISLKKDSNTATPLHLSCLRCGGHMLKSTLTFRLNAQCIQSEVPV